MNCQWPECEGKATKRLEVENLEDNRRIVGFDSVDGKLIMAYYCTKHFHEEINIWVCRSSKAKING